MAFKMNSPFKKKMGDFKHSDAPDAKGKFKDCLLYTSDAADE